MPSRARIKVEENTLYISKLLGERKILFSNFNNDLIISNDMWGLKSNSSFYFSNLSILFSNYFYSKKKLYSTGTTMIGLNDEGLNKIINQTFIRNDIKIENLLKNLFALLSLRAEIEDKLNELINKTVKLLVK